MGLYVPYLDDDMLSGGGGGGGSSELVLESNIDVSSAYYIPSGYMTSTQITVARMSRYGRITQIYLILRTYGDSIPANSTIYLNASSEYVRKLTPIMPSYVSANITFATANNTSGTYDPGDFASPCAFIDNNNGSIMIDSISALTASYTSLKIFGTFINSHVDNN